MRILLILLTIYCSCAFADKAKKEKSLRLVDIFAVEKNPGKGFLEYKREGSAEKISFGENEGHYVLGMVFNGASLPEPNNPDLKKSQIIQIAMGNLKAAGGQPIPQFGAATFIAKKIPVRPMEIQLSVPNGKGENLQNSGLLMFTSPSTPSEQSDQAKLTGTYFAKSGKVTLTPLDKPEIVEVKSQGSTFTFNRQIMKMDVDGAMISPFNPAENALLGTVEFPVYWPQGKTATELAGRLASESLSGPNPLPAAEGAVSNHKREVSGSTKKQ